MSVRLSELGPRLTMRFVAVLRKKIFSFALLNYYFSSQMSINNVDKHKKISKKNCIRKHHKNIRRRLTTIFSLRKKYVKTFLVTYTPRYVTSTSPPFENEKAISSLVRFWNNLKLKICILRVAWKILKKMCLESDWKRQ